MIGPFLLDYLNSKLSTLHEYTYTRKLVSDDFGRGFLLLLQFIHRCEKVKMISEQT